MKREKKLWSPVFLMYFSIDLSCTSRVRKIRESDNLSYVFGWKVCIFSEEHAIVCWGNNKIRRNKKHWDYICIRSKINFVLHFFPASSSLVIVTHCDHLLCCVPSPILRFYWMQETSECFFSFRFFCYFFLNILWLNPCAFHTLGPIYRNRRFTIDINR